MREYAAYTVMRIERELTWEQVFLFVDTIAARYDREREALADLGSETYAGGGGGRERHLDIEDLAEGPVPFGLGLAVVRKAVN